MPARPPQPRSPAHRPLSVAAVVALHLTALVAVLGAIAAGAFAHVPVAFGLAGAIAAAEIVGFVVLQRRAAHVVRRLADSVALVDQGRDAEAAALLDALAAACRFIPNLHALVVHRRAGMFLAAGELDEALALDGAVARSGWLGRRRSALYVSYPSLCAELAVVAALKGDAAEADAWRARAHASVTEVRRGALIFMDAVLLAKRGAYADAQREILAAGGAARLPAQTARVVRWILAFSATHVDPPAARAADVARTLETARASTREVLALAPWWPELAAFVRERAAAPAATSTP